jgi:imidazole glycerol-phosphate synthase subunit HisH
MSVATSVAIVDYGAGNVRSVERACQAVGVRSELIGDPDQLRKATRIVFPGVGHAESAMRHLIDKGLDQALREAFQAGIPILGICVGAQLILDASEESQIPCLGLLPGVAKRFSLPALEFKVPHIGWNAVRPTKPHPLFTSLAEGAEFYFVHSYFPAPSRATDVLATTDYGGDFCCALGRDNLFAAQFHPEKSGALGLALFERFSRWEGSPC